MSVGHLRPRIATLFLMVISGVAAYGAERPGAAALDFRSQWQVREVAMDTLILYHVFAADAHSLYVTTVTATDERDWSAWLWAGCPGAIDKTTSVVDRARDTVIHKFDHLASQEVSSLPDEKFAPAGEICEHGDGIFPPLELPINLDPFRPPIWLGFYSEKKEIQTTVCPATFGLRVIDAVGAYSLAAAADMSEGDILVKMSPWEYNDPVFTSPDTLRNAIKARYRPGDPVTVEFLKVGSENSYSLESAQITFPSLPIMQREIDGPVAASEDRLARLSEPWAAPLLSLLVETASVAADQKNLIDRIHRRSRLADPYRLWPFHIAYRNPLYLDSIAADLQGMITPPDADRRLSMQFGFIQQILAPGEFADLNVVGTIDFDSMSATELLDQIESVLARAAKKNAEAFAGLDDDELHFMRRQGIRLLQNVIDYGRIHLDPDITEQKANIRFLQTLERIEITSLLAQAALVSTLCNPTFIAAIQKRFDGAAIPVNAPEIRETKWGRIVIAGTGNDRYIKNSDAAVIIDLGGDDYYANNTASSIPGQIPSALIVDISGNDHYENWRSLRQGCGFQGTGVLVDLQGNDTYIGRRYCQGAGFMGIGVLWDKEGDDSYRAVDYGQGIGQMGAGLLFDDAGDNRYEGHLMCQAVGLTYGVGILHSADVAGEDLYYVKGYHESGYGDAGSFEGWGQGVGIGHRPFTSGGVGILSDNGGADIYQGGTFSQGGGYYYGMGILNDRGGADDQYRGSRYNMGFSAHQAVGVFMDDGGNDHYMTTHYVAMGMAWDESVALFVDGAGDDVYEASHFTCGAAAMNGFATFVDADGSDVYRQTTPGSTHGNSYHGGSSTALFLDLGDGDDVYGPNRVQNALYTAGNHGFFLDYRSIEAAIQDLSANPDILISK